MTYFSKAAFANHLQELKVTWLYTERNRNNYTRYTHKTQANLIQIKIVFRKSVDFLHPVHIKFAGAISMLGCLDKKDLMFDFLEKSD